MAPTLNQALPRSSPITPHRASCAHNSTTSSPTAVAAVARHALFILQTKSIQLASFFFKPVKQNGEIRAQEEIESSLDHKFCPVDVTPRSSGQSSCLVDLLRRGTLTASPSSFSSV